MCVCERVSLLLHISQFFHTHTDHVVYIVVPDNIIMLVRNSYLLTMVTPCGCFSPELELSLHYYPNCLLDVLGIHIIQCAIAMCTHAFHMLLCLTELGFSS